MKKYIFLIVALLSAVGMKAQFAWDVEVGNYRYDLFEDHHAALKGAVSVSTDEMTVPSTFVHEGITYTVTELNGWNSDKVVKTLTLPSTLVSVNVNGYINVEAFAINSSNSKFSVESGVLFSKDKTTLVCYPGGKSGVRYEVPIGVTTIGRYAFYNNQKLETIVLPEGLTTIEESAFNAIYTLNECNFPETLKRIEGYAFNDCRLVFSNNTFTLPKELSFIGDGALSSAFFDNAAMTVVFPATLGQSGSQLKVQNYAFTCNTIRSEMTDPVHCGEWAFQNVNAIHIPYGTLDAYKAKTGWNMDASRLREAANPGAETVASVDIERVLDFDNNTVSVKFSTKTNGATIRYKVVENDFYENSNPTEWAIYDGSTISVASSEWPYNSNTYYVKAIAMKAGMNNSPIAKMTIQYESLRTAMPVINCVAGDIKMTMSTTEEGAVIRYTTDGTTPTTSSSEYTGQITLNGNYTFKAKAFKEGKFPSDDQIYDVHWFRCQTPTISYEADTPNGEDVVVTITANGEGETLMYRTSNSSEDQLYKGTPVKVRREIDFYAFAKKEHFNDSETASIYLSRGNIATNSPHIQVDQNTKMLTLTAEEGASIYYTIDGKTPEVKNEMLYAAPVELAGNCTVRAIAWKKGKFQSDESSFTIDNWFSVSPVTMTQTIVDGQPMMQFASATEGAEIWYSFNWYSEDHQYNNVPVAAEEGRTVYAIAKKSGFIDSEWREFHIDYSQYTRCARPELETDIDKHLITLRTSEEGGEIYYVIDSDGFEIPTTKSTKYTESFTPYQRGYLRFVTAKEGKINSEVNTYWLDELFRLNQVTFEPQIGEDGDYMMKFSCNDPVVKDADIYYFFSGLAEKKYEGKAVSVPKDEYVYAFARKDGWLDSYTISCYVTRDQYVVSQPNINMLSEKKVLKIESIQDGTVVYWTNDGTEPTTSSPNKADQYYNPEIQVTRNCTYKFIATKAGMINSPVTEIVINDWFRAPQVIVTPYGSDDKLMVKMEVDAEDAYNYEIYWEYENRVSQDYVKSNQKYNGPFEVEDGHMIYVTAIRDGFNPNWDTTNWLYWSSYRCNPPNISIRDTVVTIVGTEGASFYYTLDGSTPTKQSLKYTAPFKLTKNCNVKAIATMEGKMNSDVRENSFWDFRVKDVEFSIYAQNNNLMMELTCNDKNATIYYKIGDGYNSEDITAEPNVKYTAPFVLPEGRSVWASATKEGFTNANWNFREGVWKSSYTANMPDIYVDDNAKVVMSGEKNATIYYTTDGKTPTTSSTKYTAPFTLSANDTVKAIAVVDRKFNSAVSEFVYNGYSVNMVTITPIVEDNILKVRLQTTTPNATIYYGINDHNAKTSANIRYTAPFTVKNGDRIFASATRNGYQDAPWSEYGEIYFSDYTCNAPIISIDGDANVSIGSDVGASIYYTLDGSIPTAANTQYTNSFQLTRNTTIKAIAIKDGMIKSDVREMTYNGFRVADPVFAQNGTTMTITTTTPEATIYYAYESEGKTVNKNSHKYTGPFDVMDNSTILAYAVRDGWYDSDIRSVNTGDKIACPMVEAVSYDGHFLTLKAIDDATIWYTTNGNDPRDNSNKTVSWIYEYKTPIAINSTGQIKAIATRKYMNPSEIATFDINFYAGENGTTLEKPGVLEEVMTWSDVSTITEFNIEGPLNQADLAFIKNNMTSLQHLDMSKTTIEDGTLPDNAFSGLPIISFTSPENITQVGNGIFTNCPELAAVRWNTTTKLPDNSFDANHNPNLLLFVRFEIAAPSHAAVENQIINGTAQSIVLVDDYASNFYCPERFYAKSIKYTHKFTMTSGNGGGWESFTLPFTPSRFIHESKGELLPFKSYEQQENQEAYRPFWLRSLNEIGRASCSLNELGFEDVGTMEANKPYIICMPNNERYATRFRLAGNVTFSATDTYVPVTNPEPAEKGNVMFVPNFMHRDKEVGILAINLDAQDEFLPGSAFLDNVRGLRPFEAYARSIGVSRQAIRIDDDDLQLATAIQDTQLIDVSGNAIIKVYNLSGNLVITGKRSEVMSKLADGVYIINGKKIAVK